MGLSLVSDACHHGDPESAPPTNDGAPGDLEPQEALPGDDVVNSGRTLSGVYDLTRPVNGLASARCVFTEQGAYARTRTFTDGRGTDTDSGSYLIDAGGRLVIYVERSEGIRRSSASREIYTLGGDLSAELRLDGPASDTETYGRAGDVPPPGPERPSVE